MKRISAERLKGCLDKHNKWLSDKEGHGPIYPTLTYLS